MRISTSWSQQLSVNEMLRQQAKVSKTQMQLSTGLRILTPSDDPTASANILDFQQSIAQTTQYQSNADTATARLTLEESVFDQAGNVLTRAKELALQANNGIMSAGDRIAIKADIDQLLHEMVGLANTKNANGEYIFAGDLSNIPPVTLNPVSKEYDYQGGVNQRVLAIGPQRQVADGDLASKVFYDIPSAGFEANATGNGKQSIFKTLQKLSDSLQATYQAPQGKLTGDKIMRYGADYSVNNTSFDLTADGVVPATTITLNANYQDIDALVTAINSQITNPPTMQARVNGNNVEFVSLAKGDASSIQIDAVTGSFLSDIGLKSGQIGVGADLDGFGSINGGQSLALGHDYSTTNSTFELRLDANTAVNITLNQNYPDINSIVTDINTQISTAGLTTKIGVAANGNSIAFKSLTQGPDSFIQINQQTGSFLQDAGFNNAQNGKGLDTTKLFDQSINAGIADLDSALDTILVTRANVGSRLNALDGQKSINDKFILDTKTVLSQTQDLDYAEAISRFTLQNNVLEAAQKSYATTQKLSLFNYL